VLTRRRSLTTLFAALALCVTAAPQAASSQAQQPPQPPPKPYEPTPGMPGKDAVWVPTSPAVVEKMLDIAKVTTEDIVVDLGSGDGRSVIAAARRGAKAIGFEYNPDLVELSRKLATEAGVADRASFVQGDMYEADFSQATVLALFLLPANLEKLKDKILALKPGSRMVVNTFTVSGWEPDERFRVQGCDNWCEVLLHIVPARIEGTWRGSGMALDLTQAFQRVSGSVTATGAPATMENGVLRGARLTFTAGGTSYTGQVTGDRMTVTTPPGTGRTWTLTRERK
jgi:SAM-dependent methyltransferase